MEHSSGRATGARGLRCKECGEELPLGASYACEFCFGPLEVVYDRDALARTVTRESIEAGPPSIWRYADLLPCAPEDPTAGLPVGLSPLVRAPRLAERLGLGEVWVKNETANPTHSFKDRVVSVALQKARELGYEVAACASTGNLAQSVAAHAAAAGMRSYVFVPADLEHQKIVATGIYGCTLVAVDGTYDDVNRLCMELAADRPWAFVNVNVRPAPSVLSARSAPPMRSLSMWLIASPRPAPCSGGRPETAWENGWKSRATSSGVRPGPVSVTANR
jgi:threonine synthase